MRPVTEYEYQRMQNQTESKFVGMSTVSIHMVAKIAGGTTAGTHTFEWDETGFICDFTISESFDDQSVKGLDEDAQTIYGIETRAGAQINLPFRYLVDGGLTIQQSPEGVYNGQDINFFSGSLGAISGDTVIAPFAPYVNLIEYNGLKVDADNALLKWEIDTMPHIAADGYSLFARAAGTAWSTLYLTKGHQVRKGLRTYAQLGVDGFGRPTLLYSNPGSGGNLRGTIFRR